MTLIGCWAIAFSGPGHGRSVTFDPFVRALLFDDAHSEGNRCRRFRAIHKELTWGLLDPHSASLFDARLDGPCDMQPEYARAIDWPISQAWRRAQAAGRPW